MKVPETLPGTDIKGNLFASETSRRILTTASDRQIAFGCWEITDTRDGIGPQLDRYGYRPDCPRFGTPRWSALPSYEQGPANIAVQDATHTRTYRTLAARDYFEAEIAKVNAAYAKDVKSAPKRAAIDARAAKGTAQLVDLEKHPDISRGNQHGLGWFDWHTHSGGAETCYANGYGRDQRACPGYQSAWDALNAIAHIERYGELDARSVAYATYAAAYINRGAVNA